MSPASPFESAIRQRLQVAGLPASSEQLSQLADYWSLLAKWNTTINLTALQLEPPADAALDRLIVEPFAVSAFVQPAQGRWYDLGSGGGSPAIPMKIAMPAWELTMVESKARKAAFLREAVRALELERVDVRTERVEDLSAASLATEDLADLVTTRAVALDAGFSRSVARLLKLGGEFFYLGSRETPSIAMQSRLLCSAEHDLPNGGRLWVFHVEQLGITSR